MKTGSSQKKKRSNCEEFMQMMKSILKLSLFTRPPGNDIDQSSSSSHSQAHWHHPTVIQPKKMTPPPQRESNRHLHGLDGEGRSSFIKIQGIENDDIGKADDHLNMHRNLQGSDQLQDFVTNLKVSDYIRRFHERNKHDSVSLELPTPPPPPPLPPHLRQDKFLLKYNGMS